MTPLKRAEILALPLALALPPALFRPLLRVPARIDGQALDDHTRWFLTLLKLDRTDRTRSSPASQRAEIDAAERTWSRPPTGVDIRDTELDLPGRRLRLRWYRPPGAGPGPGLLYLHGGGWVTGTLEGYDGLCARLAVEGGGVVASLDYRLAPEHPFPAALDDVRAAWAWFRAHAAENGLDPSRLAVGGDSAGGNLGAVLCNLLPAEAAPALQLLLYPATDLAAEAPSRARYAEGYYLSNPHVRWFADRYLDGTGVGREDPRVSPLRAPTLGRVPALVVVAGLDPLADEGRAYAARLLGEGVPVEVLEVPGMVHGFVGLDRVLPAADAAVGELCRRLRCRWAPGSARPSAPGLSPSERAS